MSHIRTYMHCALHRSLRSIIMAYICSYCVDGDYCAPSEVLLLKHIRIVHSRDPNFSIECSSEGCSRTFSNFRTFQNHRRTCYTAPLSEHVVDDIEQLHTASSSASVSAGSSRIPSFTAAEMKLHSAKWLLKTSETRSLTRTASIGIVHDVADLIEFIMQLLKERACDVLKSKGVNDATINEVESLFTGYLIRPFEGLASFHQQLQFFRERLGFIVS